MSLTSPKFKRNVSRIVPFGLIWLLTGWMFTLSEALLPKNQGVNSAVDINLTLPVFLFAAFSLTSLGLLVGTLETLVLQKRFLGYSFLRKTIFKFCIYMAIMFLAISITYPTAVAIESNSNVSSSEIWRQTGDFLLSPLFFNALLQLSFSLLLSLLYSAISENLGHNVLLNFYTGKYHKPIVEKRIFMFLDMKGSTAIAEQLGHVNYFKLLGDYYDLMSDPIINHSGEVYQYIGDEVVVSWKSPEGYQNNNCIRCFFEIKENLEKKRDHFLSRYGVVPDFKAGIHFGEATAGEIGALKKEIVFVGDVLNTTARIQGMCGEYQSDLIISDHLKSVLDEPSPFTITPLGDIKLKGKKGSMGLFSVER